MSVSCQVPSAWECPTLNSETRAPSLISLLPKTPQFREEQKDTRKKTIDYQGEDHSHLSESGISDRPGRRWRHDGRWPGWRRVVTQA